MTRLSGGASQETWAIDAAAHEHIVPLILRRAPGGAPRARAAAPIRCRWKPKPS